MFTYAVSIYLYHAHLSFVIESTPMSLLCTLYTAVHHHSQYFCYFYLYYYLSFNSILTYISLRVCSRSCCSHFFRFTYQNEKLPNSDAIDSAYVFKYISHIKILFVPIDDHMHTFTFMLQSHTILLVAAIEY